MCEVPESYDDFKYSLVDPSTAYSPHEKFSSVDHTFRTRRRFKLLYLPEGTPVFRKANSLGPQGLEIPDNQVNKKKLTGWATYKNETVQCRFFKEFWWIVNTYKRMNTPRIH